jgi:GNAT superfamily N-acetyltransferase
VTRSRSELIEAVVSGIRILDDAVPAVTPLGVAGVYGRTTAVSHPFTNGVSLARLDAASADAAIQLVVERFAAEGKAFGWFVGPGSAPDDLAARLEAAGLHKAEEWAGLVLTDLDHPMGGNPELRIERVQPETLRQHIDLLVRGFGYGTTEEVAEVMIGILIGLRDHHRARIYLAIGNEREGADEPIAFCALTGTHRPWAMNLALAATLEEHRGKGVYRSLVARRVADARADGAEVVVTQANRETSAPILRKIGFNEICSFDLYAWMPAEPG